MTTPLEINTTTDVAGAAERLKRVVGSLLEFASCSANGARLVVHVLDSATTELETLLRDIETLV